MSKPVVSDFGKCFIKFQKTCSAYEDLLKKCRRLEKLLLETRMLEEKIRELAYLKWEEAGYPPSDGVNFWLQAEEELLGVRTLCGVISVENAIDTAIPPRRVAAKPSPRKTSDKKTTTKKK